MLDRCWCQDSLWCQNWIRLCHWRRERCNKGKLQHLCSPTCITLSMRLHVLKHIQRPSASDGKDPHARSTTTSISAFATIAFLTDRQDVPDGCIAYGNPARVARVCSPRFEATGKRPVERADIFDATATIPQGIIRKTSEQRAEQDSACSGGCTFRCSPPVTQNHHSLLQRGKDALLLLIGLASLVHLVKSW